MPKITIVVVVLVSIMVSCKKSSTLDGEIAISGAMKNVMWQGQLDGVINLDTISNTKNLYGLGPLSNLKGELLILDGQFFQSKVLSDSTMLVKKSPKAEAPFFVYGWQQNWKKLDLPKEISTVSSLERWIPTQVGEVNKPFIVKLIGVVSNAKIHIQNLPDNTKVSSPKEAHIGQVNYSIGKEEVTIVGFYSTKHKGIFTHHDSNLHLHLITNDLQKMGHLDDVAFSEMKIFLPTQLYQNN